MVGSATNEYARSKQGKQNAHSRNRIAEKTFSVYVCTVDTNPQERKLCSAQHTPAMCTHTICVSIKNKNEKL